jgi:YrbI family 3-deoxy-D-manno-octulosonate 8-phosphate phosphatase
MVSKNLQAAIKTTAKRIQMVVFDFDGVFTDNRVLVLEDGMEGVFCNRGDGFGLEALRRLGLSLLVLTTEKNPVVRVRCQKLKIPCIQGCGDKFQTLRKVAKKYQISLSNIAFVGNDINDLDCLSIVGFPVCVADSHPSVSKRALLKTKAKGGHGAVREFCDFLEKMKTSDESIIK